ncbi:hypothetical protein LINPERPRIM_LOCUS35256 [Linum perenne]
MALSSITQRVVLVVVSSATQTEGLWLLSLAVWVHVLL